MAAFVVISGADAGAFCVRQLLRAAAAGRLAVERVVVVDRNAACAVTRTFAGEPHVRLAVCDWADWLDANLDAMPPGAHLVPYHWAPHLLREWLERQVRRRGGRAERGGAVPAQAVPWEHDLPSGDRALSFATWVCPPTCIEPAVCPHTRGAKDWSLAGELARPRTPGDAQPIVFRALHLAYGVGTIPVRDVLEARDRIVAGLGAGRREYLVATASHCHGLAATLRVGPRC